MPSWGALLQRRSSPYLIVDPTTPKSPLGDGIFEFCGVFRKYCRWCPRSVSLASVLLGVGVSLQWSNSSQSIQFLHVVRQLSVDFPTFLLVGPLESPSVLSYPNPFTTFLLRSPPSKASDSL
ncbi:uncharacterized protein BJX67DRAFT_244826 [Aspergillus lucknowensis]|uniref:Uncharacterized protein n=1 Tax=Aspergillus lucknowensis TaxID=176173 RepID=A0ABR4M1G2_9EURO